MWDELSDDIKAELTDKRFPNRSHHSRSTYADGCRGPLCRKSERDRSRRRTAYRAQRKGKPYAPVPRAPEDLALDAHLDQVVAWLKDPKTVIPSGDEQVA